MNATEIIGAARAALVCGRLVAANAPFSLRPSAGGRFLVEADLSPAELAAAADEAYEREPVFDLEPDGIRLVTVRVGEPVRTAGFYWAEPVEWDPDVSGFALATDYGNGAVTIDGGPEAFCLAVLSHAVGPAAEGRVLPVRVADLCWVNFEDHEDRKGVMAERAWRPG